MTFTKKRPKTTHTSVHVIGCKALLTFASLKVTGAIAFDNNRDARCSNVLDLRLK